jgi:signal transduction histidine kinase
VTLAQRLLLAIGVLSVATTLALGFGLREAWRRTEAERFEREIQRTTARLRGELAEQGRTLPVLVRPLCRHDPVVDSALVDLEAGRLDAGRRLALSLRVPELMRAFALDELWLVTQDGRVLGAGHADGEVGKRVPTLGARLARPPSNVAELRAAEPPLALVTQCSRDGKRTAVGLVAARHVAPLLERVSGADVRLALDPPRGEDAWTQALRIEELGGLTVYAVASRGPLNEALRRLDGIVLLLGSASTLIALALALLVSRGLARPIVRLSRQAREVVHGEPKPVEGSGGKELRELADAFNAAIRDLVQLRKRLAATERIAARREIARRVAHEIKNPLLPIRAAVETLRRLRAREDPAFDGYFDEATRTVLEEVTRISNIVTEFTRFARLPPPTPAPMDLVETIHKVVLLHASGAVPVTLEAASLPLVTADRDQMVQVMTNLVQNALDACDGVPDARVSVRVLADGPRASVVVRDQGRGVPQEIRDKLFEPYATTKEKGTGLGLAIVQRIIIEHGGEILHRDAAGGGTEFEFWVPIAGPSLLAEPPAPSSLAPPVGTRRR